MLGLLSRTDLTWAPAEAAEFGPSVTALTATLDPVVPEVRDTSRDAQI
jgi:hypothetical protein